MIIEPNEISNWRESEGHQLLLLYFVRPNERQNLPRSYNWSAVLGESLESAVERLIADGALNEVTEAKWRIWYGRKASELKELCRIRGLKVSGTIEQLSDRLACVDPMGAALGCSRRLYMCSGEAARLLDSRRDYLGIAMSDLRDFGTLFAFQELQAERITLANRSENASSTVSSDDVKWSLLSQKALQYARQGDLGLSRNVYLSMAEFLKRRSKLKESLSLYLLVCGYDLNGAENRGSLPNTLLGEFPLFDSKTAFLAPAVLDSVQDLMKKIPLPLDDVYAMYSERTAIASFPLPIDRSWRVLAAALDGQIDLDDQPACFNDIRRLLHASNVVERQSGSDHKA